LSLRQKREGRKRPFVVVVVVAVVVVFCSRHVR